MIKEEQMEGFNIPQYTPSPSEVELEVEKEGSFSITAMEVSVVPWNAYDDSEYGNLSESLRNGGYNVAKCMRAVAEPLLISHFGEAIVEEVFYRYQQILTETMSEEKNHFVNVTISLIRKERSA